MKGNEMTTTKSTTKPADKGMSAATRKSLATLAGRFNAAEGKTIEAIVKASLIAADYVAKGGVAQDLVNDDESKGTLVSKGTVSKRVALGKALKVVGDVPVETVRAIKATLEGDQGDRQALVEATRKGSSSGVVAATKGKSRKVTGNKPGKGKSNAHTVSLDTMTTAALVEHLAKVLEAIAGREDVAEVGVPLDKVAKSATLIAKNVLAMPVK